MFKNWFKYKPTLQEEQFIEIVEKMLKDPKTTLKMAPLSDKYYLSNPTKHYYLVVRDSSVQITNSKFSLDSYVNSKVIEIIIKMIQDVMEVDRQKFEDIIFQNQTQMLNGVLKSLKGKEVLV